jgi:hypothetical protein
MIGPDPTSGTFPAMVAGQPRSDTTTRGNRMLRSALVVLAVTAAVWVVSAGSLLFYTSSTRDPREFTLVIPAGTQEAIARGENPLEIPATWSFQADDTLTLENRDTGGHWLGSFYVPPEETRSFILRPALAGLFSCSLHPTGEIVLDIELRRFDWAATLIPTLVVGPALGLAAVALRRVMRLLG